MNVTICKPCIFLIHFFLCSEIMKKDNKYNLPRVFGSYKKIAIPEIL